MLRSIFVVLLALATVQSRNVKRQAPLVVAPACPFALLPVLNVCPPCQPTSCYCANGKELTTEDQAKAETDKSLPCEVTPENQYGLPARCDCLPPGEGFSFQDVIGKLQAAAAAAQQQALSAQEAISAQPPQQAEPAPVDIHQERAPEQLIPLENPEARQDAAPIPQAPTPAETPAQSSCPRPVLPVLNACPPCTPTDCFCADGKKLTLEDQAKAYQTQTPPCASIPENPHGLPARCSCEEPGSGFTFQEILAQLAQQLAQQAQSS